MHKVAIASLAIIAAMTLSSVAKADDDETMENREQVEVSALSGYMTQPGAIILAPLGYAAAPLAYAATPFGYQPTPVHVRNVNGVNTIYYAPSANPGYYRY